MRENKIDIFKGLLIILMVIAHCNQFFGDFSKVLQVYFTDFVNIIAFSGFLFSFGYVFYKAYLLKDRASVYKNILRNVFKTYLAFSISGIAFKILVTKEPISLNLISNVVLLREFPGWSEFLISFSFVTLIALILFNVLKLLSLKGVIIWGGISLLACLIPYNLIASPILAVIVGSSNYITFPVVQYSIFFGVGILFAKEQIRFNYKFLTVFTISTLVFVIKVVLNQGALPSRFPPSIYWICGSALPIYLIYLLSCKISNLKHINFISCIGKNTLIYLLVSNILIFTLSGYIDKYNGFAMCSIIAIVVIILINYIISIVRK